MLACAARPRLRTLLATFSAKYVAVGSPPSAKYVAVGSSAWPRVEAAAVAGRAWAGVEALPLAVCRADALGPTSGSLAVSHSLTCTLKPSSCTVMLRERCDGGEVTMPSFCNAATLANFEPTTLLWQTTATAAAAAAAATAVVLAAAAVEAAGAAPATAAAAQASTNS